jgi:hypothetical protein
MKKALFNVGDTVKYTGTREASSGTDEFHMQPSIFPGMVAKIIEIHDPQKGSGPVKLHSGETIFDRNEDGYNVYQNEYGNKAIIWPRDKKDWELI